MHNKNQSIPKTAATTTAVTTATFNTTTVYHPFNSKEGQLTVIKVDV